MAYRGQGQKVQKVMVQPIRSRIQVWLYEQVNMRIEGCIIGFDEYMNLVLDDAEEVHMKTKNRKPLGYGKPTKDFSGRSTLAGFSRRKHCPGQIAIRELPRGLPVPAGVIVVSVSFVLPPPDLTCLLPRLHPDRFSLYTFTALNIHCHQSLMSVHCKDSVCVSKQEMLSH
ncbi:Small nuclear ribonucleoprotein E [Anabarilius grahami]|uniref:Small nuclear ribonucleoprotein E n=1 Tax=Anabarilius grahami TaxID=495550 RepID=A0A3N0XG53_ANAGA|nr:Small nuclear ribonucleoprotein E [Anabarilius grahami]